MEFTLVNGDVAIGSVNVLSVSNSSLVMAGDLERVRLVSCFETPLEAHMFGPVMADEQDGD